MKTLRSVLEMKKLIALFTILLASFVILSGAASAADSDIIINEYVSHPSAGNEWVELHNYGTENVDLNGWTIKDQDGDVFKIWSVSTIIPGKGFIVAEHAIGALVDAGDSITISNEKAGTELHTQTTSYIEDIGMGKSKAYIVQDSDHWKIFSTPTPAESNIPIVSFASDSLADEAIIITREVTIKIQNDVDATTISSSSVTMDDAICTAVKTSKVEFTCTGYGDEDKISYFATITDSNGQTSNSEPREFTTDFTKSVVATIPTVQKALDEDLETTATVTITLTNDGESPLTFDIADFTVSDLKYNGLESSGYATDRDGFFIDSSKISLVFTPAAATTINPTEKTTLLATITVPKEGDLDFYGTYNGAFSYIDTEDKLGTTPLIKDMSIIVNPPHKSGKLDIDLDFDNDAHYRTEDVEITVTIDNKHSEKVKSIKVELEIPELGIKEEASKFSLDDGDEKDITFEFSLDDDVDAGNYPIYVYVTGESEDSNDNDITIQNFDVSEELEIDVESDDLTIESVKISDDELKAGESFVTTIKIANIGSSDQDDVRVRFECSDLDISELSDITDELRDGKTLSKVFNVKVPASADDGSYLCEVAVMYDGYKDQEDEDGFGEHLTKQISLEIAGGLGNNVEDEQDGSAATITGTTTASVVAGSESRFVLNLKNTDTSGSETYVIDFDGVSWAEDARIEPDELTIPAGTDVPFYVYLTPEAGTSGTKTAEVVVYVDDEEVASKTLTVTVRGDGSGIQVDDLGNQITGSVVGPIDMPTAIIVSSVVAGMVLLGAVYMFTLAKVPAKKK
ncbi:putative S-layer protein [Candidatus Woesearchaeota archaeon]|nr:putative S-layer protein [Candidatus Woesearchaeota archaeon]